MSNRRREDKSETGILVCVHVFRDERPALLAFRDDALVCLMCGDSDHADSPSDYRVVGAQHVVDRDPGVGEVLHLELGQELERVALGEPWVAASAD